MATEATEGPTGAKTEGSRDEESGQFLIERRTEPMLPPAGSEADQTEAAAALDDELESVVIEAVPAGPVTARPKPSLPPPVPAAASVRPLAAEATVAEAVIPALTPNYRGLTISDHVELRFDDLSLDLENNPYTRSSLVPPPRKPRSVGRLLLGAAVLMALAVGGAVVLRGQPTSASVAPRPAPVATAPVAARTAAAVTPEPLPVTAVPDEPAAAAPSPVEAPAAVPVVAVAEPAESAVVEARKTVAVADDTQAAAPANVTPTVSAAADAVAVTPPTPSADAPTVAADAPTVAAADEPAVVPAAVAAAVAATDVPAAEPTASPETLSREDVMAGFEKLREDITTCAAGGHGRTTAKVTIAGSGRVTYAVIEGAFAGTPEGSCMALILRKATFPSFASATLKVAYPFAL